MKNSEFIHDALNELEDAYIEEVESLRKREEKEVVKDSETGKTNRNRRKMNKYLGLAAGICLCVFGTWIYANFISSAEKNIENQENIQQEKQEGEKQELSDEANMVISESKEEVEDEDNVKNLQEEETTDSDIAYMNFAVRLFQSISEEENVLVSPFSVYTALGMLESGAENETLEQLKQVLGLDTAEMNTFFEKDWNTVDEKLKIANSVWITDDARFSVKDTFLAVAKENYQADITQLLFDETAVKSINQWVEEHTDGTVKEILDKIPEDTVMYLINTLFFASEWDENYEDWQVGEGSFTGSNGIKQTIDMMYSDEFYYLEDENAEGFLKYYEGGKYAFVALLPTEGMELSSYIDTLTGETLKEILSHTKEIHVNAGLPKFEVEYQTELEEVLKGLGVTDVFDGDKADLSGIGTSTAGNLFVSGVLHKTFIEVAPMGTTAGASTVVEIKEESAIDFGESKEVILNRPFLYMIINCESCQPIFMGTLNNFKET